MNIIFCLSYLSINQTIFLIEKHGVNNVIVVTSNRRVESFLQLIYDENIIFFSNSSSMLLPKKAHQFILFPLRVLDVLIKKKKAWRYFKVVKNRNVYFFFNSAGFFHAWLIHKLSKNNTLYYKENLNLDNFKQLATREGNLNVEFIKLLYNEEVIPLNQQFGITYKMSEKYLNKCAVQTLDIDHSSDEISSIISSKVDFPNGEILYLPPLIDEVKVSSSLYINFVDTIIDYCRSENIKIHLKRHPRSLEKYSKENQIFEIPIHFPANCLVDYKLTISLASATLFEIANRGGVAISLIKILMKDDLNLIKSTMDYLNSNLDVEKEIFYPEDIKELKELISYYI